MTWRRLDAVIAINPELDRVGVVLFGVNRSARRLSDTAQAAIVADVLDPGVVLTSTIRHVEAAAQETRERGLLVHELEKAVLAGPKW